MKTQGRINKDCLEQSIYKRVNDYGLDSMPTQLALDQYKMYFPKEYSALKYKLENVPSNNNL